MADEEASPTSPLTPDYPEFEGGPGIDDLMGDLSPTTVQKRESEDAEMDRLRAMTDGDRVSGTGEHSPPTPQRPSAVSKKARSRSKSAKRRRRSRSKPKKAKTKTKGKARNGPGPRPRPAKGAVFAGASGSGKGLELPGRERSGSDMSTGAGTPKLDASLTLSAWAAQTHMSAARARLKASKERSNTLPLRLFRSGSAAGAGALGLPLRAVSPATRPSSSHQRQFAHKHTEQKQKNEVDLSIAALENLAEDCGKDDTLVAASKVKEQVMNVMFLLRKFQVDSRINAALRELELKKYVTKHFVKTNTNMVDSEDQEVAKWISENVFAPTELARMNSSLALDSAEQYLDRAAELLPPSERKRKSSLPGVFRVSSSGSRSASLAPDDDSELLEVESLLLTSDVSTCLSSVDTWDFDVFTFADLVPGKQLLVMVTHLFSTVGLLEKFNVPRRCFNNFFTSIQEGYLANPYHNATHATDVVQNMYAFMRSMKSFSAKISSLDIFAALIAAAIHDVGHPGTTNAFQIATNSPLAVRYNDRSVLENFHLAEAFRLLKDPDNDILSGLDPAVRKEVRESIILMVLATDMQAHLPLLTEMQTRIDSKTDGQEVFDRTDRQDVHLLLKTALHCADVANPCKPLALYVKWVDRIVLEWYQQGDRERELGLEVSPLMDRNKPNVPKSQLGFMDFFIQPLFETWAVVIPESKVCLDHLQHNRSYYQSLVVVPSPKPKPKAVASATLRVSRRTQSVPGGGPAQQAAERVVSNAQHRRQLSGTPEEDHSQQ